MAITLPEIVEYLEQANIKFDVRYEYSDILTCLPTIHFRNEDGDSNLPVMIHLEEDGKFIKIYSPACYYFGDTKDKQKLSAFFQALLIISFYTKMVQFEVSPVEKAVYVMVEFPVEDGTITKKQLSRCLIGIAQVIDEFDSVIRHALQTGQITLVSPLTLEMKEEKEIREDDEDEWI